MLFFLYYGYKETWSYRGMSPEGTLSIQGGSTGKGILLSACKGKTTDANLQSTGEDHRTKPTNATEIAPLAVPSL